MHYPYSMGETAENVAERWEVGRDLQDDFALASQQKPSPRSRAAGSTRRLSRSRPRSGKASRSSFRAMSTARGHLADALARLRPAFREAGRSPPATVPGSTTGRRPCSSWRRPAPASSSLPLARVDVDGCRRRRSRDHGLRPGTRDARPSTGPGSGSRTSTSSSSTRRSPPSRSSASTSWGSTRTRST